MNDYFVRNAEHAAEGIAILPGVQQLLQRLKVRAMPKTSCGTSLISCCSSFHINRFYAW